MGKFKTNDLSEMTIKKTLLNLGWSSFFQKNLPDIRPKESAIARITGLRKNFFQVNTGDEEFLATLSGRTSFEKGPFPPAIGDWVILKGAKIINVLPRKNALTRQAAGNRSKKKVSAIEEQVIAANLDNVFIVCGLDRDFNLRRIERYLTLVYGCGLDPVVILTKADLHEDTSQFIEQVEEIAISVPIHLVSSKQNQGLEELEQYLESQRTITMIGSSGAGKSTLLNKLANYELMPTGQVSQSQGKGKHTTTSRELFVLPQGGMLIDNPGIREIAVFSQTDSDGVSSVFPEIEELALGCRFSDCSHTHEPGCAVLSAVSQGEISEGRLESYRKMKREVSFAIESQTKSADRLEKERWKGVSCQIKSLYKKRPK